MPLKKKDIIYIYLDGDNIGNTLEEFILNGDLTIVSSFSNSINNAISEITLIINNLSGAKLIVAGGDDILFSVPYDTFKEGIIEEIAKTFLYITKCTLSGGIGRSAQIALLNLKKAKNKRNGEIVITE